MRESSSTAREEEISRRLLLAGTAATAAVVLTGCAQESRPKETHLEARRRIDARRAPSKATKLERFFPSKEAFTKKREEPPEALRDALERYGWSLPLCVWSDGMHPQHRERIRPLYCVTVSELLRRYPLSRDFITTYIIEAARGTYDPTGPRNPESVIQTLTDRGFVLACVPKGSNKGVVTLGHGQPPDPAAVKDACKDAPETALVFGALVGTATQTPVVSLSADGQALYEQYYQQCKERQRTGAARESLMDGAGTTATEEEKKAAEAAKKAKEAAEAAAKAKKEAEEAEKKADEARANEKKANENAAKTLADDGASAAEREQAIKEWQKAHEEREDAEEEESAKQRAAAEADQAAAEAEEQALKYDKDHQFAKAVEEANEAFKNRSKDSGLVGSVAEWVIRIHRAVKDRYFECMEGECGYASCESEARAKAFEEEVRSYQSLGASCNTEATPLPDKEHCYDKPGGMFDVPQVTLVEGLKLACKILEKVSDIDCKDIVPPQIFKAVFTDPCSSPYAMCAPDTVPPQGGGGGSRNKSAVIPKGFHGSDPTVWMNPRSTRQPQGGSNPRGETHNH